MAKYMYGLIFESQEERKRFVEDAKQKMEELDISVPDLADRIGYNRKSVYQFFADSTIRNKFLAAAIADYLRIHTG